MNLSAPFRWLVVVWKNIASFLVEREREREIPRFIEGKFPTKKASFSPL